MKIASLLLFRWLLGSDCKMEMNSTKINATGDKPETDRRERESVRVRKKGSHEVCREFVFQVREIAVTEGSRLQLASAGIKSPTKCDFYGVNFQSRILSPAGKKAICKCLTQLASPPDLAASAETNTFIKCRRALRTHQMISFITSSISIRVVLKKEGHKFGREAFVAERRLLRCVVFIISNECLGVDELVREFTEEC
ncbi:hypothetical protein LSTR_LSTR017686 [Laodelphax striatellus]|uniref:Uncharacterized protein n=1 Tax=Laodelphax striatellus TaxID=195883 RepID=A0A482WP85_LAOST|nr:hypothetical protein LSTR_LSTR017686 [Laodelphax striatellus]